MDLARSTNYNMQNKNYCKKDRSVAIKHTSEAPNRKGSYPQNRQKSK